MKFFIWLIFSLLCVVFALLPEITMYFIWHLINPSTDVMRVVVIAIFIFGGGSACVLFTFISLAIWGKGTEAIL